MSYKKLPPAEKIYAPFSNYFSIATIFRPNGNKERTPFTWSRETDTYLLEISGLETLDAKDLDILLGVLHIAGKSQTQISGGDADVLALQATGAVHPSHFDTYCAEFSRYEILALLGRSRGKKEYEAVKESLIRLSKVSFRLEYKYAKQWMSSNLLSASGLDGDCKVVLNRELGHGLVSNYSRVWFDEREDLSDAGRILHTFLSGSIREGGKSFISYKVDTLVEHVYGVSVNELERRKLHKYRSEVYEQAVKLSALWVGSGVVVASKKIGDACFTFIRPPRALKPTP